jgi:transcriptional regulator with XRE-family HTH domain
MRKRKPNPRVVFGDHLRQLRSTRNLSQERLAIKSDLGVNIIGRLERAIIAPGLLTLLKLSVALEVELEELLSPFTPDVITDMNLITRPAPRRSTRGRKVR